MPHPVRLFLALAGVLVLSGPGRSEPAATAAPAEWDFVQETAPRNGLSTGDAVEVRFLVQPDRGLRVEMQQSGPDTAATSSMNDLDLVVVGPDGVHEGHAFVGEATPGAGALPVEHVELAPEDVSPGVWTVRVLGEWVPAGREGYRLSVAGHVQLIVDPGDGVPLADLAQNDPNPVRTTTTIRFTLEGRSDILLGVYDIAGRPVRTLASGSLGAGPHTVTWDARDGSGARVAPGIYFYRLEGVGIDVTRKLVVIR